MKERLVTFGFALAALLLFYALFVPKPAPPENRPTLPLSSEAGADGYQAAWRWLQEQRIPVVALHDRYDRLTTAELHLKPTGNVLLTTLPHKLPSRARESAQLDLWIQRGNTLLVMAALDDTPVWIVSEANPVPELSRLTRLKFDAIEADRADGTQRSVEEALKQISQGEDLTLEARGEHPLMQGVHSLHAVSPLPSSHWRASPMDRSALLQIAQLKRQGYPALWLRRQGNGRIIVIAVASLFSNRLIGDQDNAQLLSNLVGWSAHDGGAVIFDDAHQGSVAYYDAKAFFADSRLHRSLGWILLLWFIFVLGVQRLRSRARVWNPIDVTAFVAVSGEFFASTLPPAVAGQRLLQNFFNTIRRRLNLPQDGNPVWEWLAAQAGVAPNALAELRRLDARVQAGRRVDLLRLQNLLSQLQGHLI
jgi:hypothetical protein